MTDITVGGETFNVVVEGDESKEVLVLAHQLGGDLHVWDAQIPALLEHFRIVRYDSRGHGASVADEGPYSVARLTQDALGIMDALGVEKAHWLGIGMGAIVGQGAMIQAPERIRRAVLASTAAQIGTPDIWNARIQTVRAAGMADTADALAERWFTQPFREAEPEAVETTLSIARATPLQGYLAACAALRDADQREAIRSIKNKVLVVVGRHDPAVPPALGALVAHSIDGAKLVTLEAAHISNIEDAENFTETVVDFLTAADIPARALAPRRKTPARRSSARQVVARPAPATKAPAKKATVKKVSVKKASAKKASVKKTPAKKAPAKKAVMKKAAVSKKAAVKKSAVKKSAARKTVTRQVVKKAAAKTSAFKAVQKKATASKAATKKTAVKKAVPKKTAAKTTTKAISVKRGAAKKAPAKKAPARKKT
ncbi:MAG: 3-oxoadipate enol-lactonase [Methylocella sp.]